MQNQLILQSSIFLMADPIGHQVISWLKIRNINLSDNTVNCMGAFLLKVHTRV